MKKTHLFLALMLSSGLLFTSCNKDEEEEETPDPTPTAAPSNPIPAPAGANGAFVAVETVTYVSTPLGEISQNVGLGVAVYGDLATPTYSDCGTVSLNGNGLTKQSTNNAYIYTPAATDVDGIDFGSGINWTCGGNSSTGAPSFNYTPSNPLPPSPNYNGSTSIGRTADFSVSSSVSLVSADSVIYNLVSSAKTISKVVSGNTGTVTFSAAEMGTLSTGSGYLQIVPYNIESSTIGGKVMYFINETVLTKQVTFN